MIFGLMNTASLAGHNCTFEGSLDSTNGTDGTWFALQAVRSNANTIETATGALAATPAYSWELSVNACNYFRIRATAHTSGTATWKIQRGTYATEPIPGAQVSGTQPVSGTVTANLGAATTRASDGRSWRSCAASAPRRRWQAVRTRACEGNDRRRQCGRTYRPG